MCGIAGTFRPGEGLPSARLLRRMLYQIRHRGPDGFGILRAPGIGLAHARLSIIDLEGGSQPMSNEDGTVWITFNGEIFNYPELRRDLLRAGHVFRTESDTETILHLYEDHGEKALSHLNGQFAFAIWDGRKEELFLARDRMGIRPLFYTQAGGGFLFGSEIKALFADEKVPRAIDPVALDDLFTFWFPLSPRTAFEGVRELPPAHWMRVSASERTIRRYWDLPLRADPRGDRSEAGYVEELRHLLDDAARIQLRADVPVGAYLSGGLDSSLIASLASRHAPRALRTYSVRFEDPEFDESDKQDLMASHLRAEHDAVTIAGKDIADHFGEVLWHTETPIVRTAPVPLFLLSRRVRESGYKVVLTGEGADEVLAGYDLFKEMKVRLFMAACPSSRMRPLLLQRLYPYLRHSPTRSVGYAAAFFCSSPAPFHRGLHSHAPRWKMTAMGKSFFSEDLVRRIVAAESAPERAWRLLSPGPGAGNPDPLSAAQAIEIRTLLPGYILSSQGDRMAMAHSVEGRFPFLDHRLVEFAFRVPASLRMRGLTEKYLLRRSAKGLLPEAIRKMVKQPYRAPDAGSFLAGRIPESVADLLSPRTLAESGFFDPGRVAGLVRKCREADMIGFKDNMAFTAILSTQYIHRLFLAPFPREGEVSPERVRMTDVAAMEERT